MDNLIPDTLISATLQHLQKQPYETANIIEISVALNISKTKALAAAEALEKQGLVKLIRITSKVLVKLTKAGLPDALPQAPEPKPIPVSEPMPVAAMPSENAETERVEPQNPATTGVCGGVNPQNAESVKPPSQPVNPLSEKVKPKRNPPYTPNPTRGYVVEHGKVKIYLDRQARSRVLTLTVADLQELVRAVEKAEAA